MTYDPVPGRAAELKVDLYWCGSEVCDCHYFQINAVTPPVVSHGSDWACFRGVEPERQTTLWTGSLFDGLENDDLKAELREACGHYGIPAEIEGDDPWDWEGGLVLS